jgi:hypothetical protein
MRYPWVPLLALAAGSRVALALEVEHAPLTCAVPDRYVRIAARGMPADDVVAGEVGFRPGPTGDWYAVAMAAAEGGWTATLPRPTAGLARFEYRVVLTGKDASAATFGPIAVAVTAECRAVEGPAAASGIFVRVPPGAPAIPPVPPGFSPIGSTAPAPVIASGGRDPGKLLLGLGVAGLAGGVIVAAGSATGDEREDPGPPDIPTLAFERTVPAPGASLSAQRDTLQIFVRMDHELRAPLDLGWSFELSATDGGPVCATMSGLFNDAQRPTGLIFSAPLQVSGACGTTFDVASSRLRIFTGNSLLLDQRIGLPYKITP